MWSLKSKIRELLELKLMLRARKNEDQSILRPFENINIKHYGIMNSRKTNLKLIENITSQVPNTASIETKVFCSMFLIFLKK